MPKPCLSGMKTNSMWILLRGLCREHGHWGDFPKQLSTESTDVLTIDIPGTGEYWQEESETSIELTMHRVRQRYHQITDNRKTKIHLIAISMGGMIATAWAQHFPDDIETMTLINTSFSNMSAIKHRLKPSNIPLFLNLLVNPNSNNETKILARTSNTSHDPAIISHWLAIAEKRPISLGNALKQLYAASQYSAPKYKPNVDILLLASEQDRLVDFKCSCDIAEQWHVQLAIHPTAGHDLPLDDPNSVIDKINQWHAERKQN